MPRSVTAMILGVSYAALLGAVLLWPTHVDENLDVVAWPGVATALGLLGLSDAVGYQLIEIAANVVLFAPLGVIVALSVRRHRVWWTILVAGLASVAVESIQWLWLPGRTASFVDVVANITGAAVAALVVTWLSGWRRANSARV